VKTNRLSVILLSIGLSPIGDAQVQSATQPALIFAKSGDAASGVVISENDTQLRLNVTPCAQTASVVVFQKPYSKSVHGTTTCGGVTKALAQVLKQ